MTSNEAPPEHKPSCLSLFCHTIVGSAPHPSTEALQHTTCVCPLIYNLARWNLRDSRPFQRIHHLKAQVRASAIWASGPSWISECYGCQSSPLFPTWKCTLAKASWMHSRKRTCMLEVSTSSHGSRGRVRWLCHVTGHHNRLQDSLRMRG